MLPNGPMDILLLPGAGSSSLGLDIVAGALRELCKAHGDDLELCRIVLLDIRLMLCG